MYIVVDGTDHAFQYNSEVSLLENFKKNKISIKSSCGGHGKCVDCKVKIVSTDVTLPPLSLEEEQVLGNVFFITKERLACQLSHLDIEHELKLSIVNKS